MDLSQIPRRRYTHGPTPIEILSRLSAALGGPTIYVKRDDLLGLAGGGNKTRKLEFLVAEALAQGADTLITCGAMQSNHCRLTLGAAAVEGLDCWLVLQEPVAGSYPIQGSGNHFLFSLLGVDGVKVVPQEADMNAALDGLASELTAAGHHPYVIPEGGSNPLGATGYVDCAREIQQQCSGNDLNLSHVISPSGSAGTQAGLVTGFHQYQPGVPVIGINVGRSRQAQEEKVFELVQKTTDFLELEKVPRDAVVCIDGFVGQGYAFATPEMCEAVQMFAQLEGILLDPVYNGKAAAGLIDLVRNKHFDSSDNILFLHTGGSPALFVYQDVLLGDGMW